MTIGIKAFFLTDTLHNIDTVEHNAPDSIILILFKKRSFYTKILKFFLKKKKEVRSWKSIIQRTKSMKSSYRTNLLSSTFCSSDILLETSSTNFLVFCGPVRFFVLDSMSSSSSVSPPPSSLV